MIYLPEDGHHPSTNWAQHKSNFLHALNSVNHYAMSPPGCVCVFLVWEMGLLVELYAGKSTMQWMLTVLKLQALFWRFV